MSLFETTVIMGVFATFALLAFSAYVIASGVDEILAFLRSEEAERIRRASDE